MKDRFPISTLERFSDIKAHTFRVWEQRYNFIKPSRTKSNFRYYSIEDLNQLLNISLLTKCGYKVSKLSKLTYFTILKMIDELTGDEEVDARENNQLIISMLTADIEKFEMILDNFVMNRGIDHTIKNIIIPFINRVNLLSYNNKSCEAHFAVTAIRKKIIYGIEKAMPIMKLQKKALFFLPYNEHFDLMLLYMNYLAKGEGYRTLYLGTDVPMKNLENIVIDKQPDQIFTYITQKNTFAIVKFSQFLEQQLPGTTLIISGFINKECIQQLPSNVKFVEHQLVQDVIVRENDFYRKLEAC